MKNIKIYFAGVLFCLKYAFKFVPYLTIGIGILFAVNGVIPYGSSYLLGKLVDAVISGVNNGVFKNVTLLLILYALVNTIPHILSNLRRYTLRHWRLRFSMETELSMLDDREKIDIAHLEDPKFQDLSQRAFRMGCNPVYNLTEGQFKFAWDFSSFVIGSILVINFNPIVYLVVLLTAIPSFLVDIKFVARGWSIWAKDSPEQRRFADLRSYTSQKNRLIETKLIQSGKKFLFWMREILTNFNSQQLSNEKTRFWAASTTDALAFVGLAGGLFLVVSEVKNGTAPVGSIVYMLGALSSMKNAINSLVSDISRQFEDSLVVMDMKEVLETKPFVIEAENPTKLDLKKAPEIIFENVGFKYKNTDEWSLRNINMTFRSGDKIGLVGNNGAGKTTLVKLLCRVYDPTEGRILVDGVDLKEVSMKEWWSYLAVMLQDYAGYNFVAKDAIGIGRPNMNTNLTRVVEAAQIGQAHSFINEWSNKYDQQIGVEFGGAEPSKGQRQKLAIARIIYRKGLVMVLDEPTASVDAESEAKIFDSIENLSKETTAILISHDFSTISECNKIFVLERGRLIEEGDHKELMSKKGVYADLYNLQAKRFKK